MTEEQLAILRAQSAPAGQQGSITMSAPPVSAADLQAMGIAPAIAAQGAAAPPMDPATLAAVSAVPPAPAPAGMVIGPDGNPLQIPPNSDAGNPQLQGTPDPAQSFAPQQLPSANQAPASNPNIPTQNGFPIYNDWVKSLGFTAKSQISLSERESLLKGYLEQQKEFLSRQNPEKQIKIEKDRIELQKSSMEQADAVNKKSDAIPELQNNVQLLDDLLASNGLSSAVGAKDAAFLFGLKKDPVAGTNAADFMARLEQVQGKNFLAAFNQLKGAGQITEIEGAKAQAAIGRLNTNQSEGEFRKSVAELRGIMQTGLDRAKSRLGNQGQVAAAPSAPVIRTIPGRGTYQSLGNGQWKQIQ